MLIKTSDLSRGEKLLVERRREEQTQAQAAKRRRVSLYIYRKWETDVEQGPLTKVGRLEPHEQCVIMRRREEQTAADLAEELGVCRWWLCQMEKGVVPHEDLVAHWAA